MQNCQRAFIVLSFMFNMVTFVHVTTMMALQRRVM